jgi:hypothetical protein
MPKPKTTKDYGKTTLARVRKEMAQPRVVKSAQKQYADLALSDVSKKVRKSAHREAGESHLRSKRFEG